jgi:hypothetical protein
MIFSPKCSNATKNQHINKHIAHIDAYIHTFADMHIH